MNNKLFLVPACIAVVLYINTLEHQYTLDDNAVITNHRHVKDGFAGLGKIFTTNMLNGFENFNDGLYRPLPLATFALEKELFNNKPFFSHLFNVLIYALLVGFLSLLLQKLFFKEKPWLAMLLAILFAAHPVHTEAVANVKGRDELLAFLFVVLAALQLFAYLQKKANGKLLSGGLFFLLAVLSKESAITGVLAIPLLFVFTSKGSIKQSATPFFVLAAIALPWFLWRQHVISSMPREVDEGVFGLLNNSFAGAENFSEKLGSALWLQVLYLWKLILPHPLSHDYSFNQIEVVGLGSGKAIAGLVIIVALLFVAFKKWKEKSLLALGILWYFITVSPASNFLLLIGVTFAERLLFAPSLGLILALAVLLGELVKSRKSKVKNQKGFSIVQILKKNTAFAALSIGIFLSYGFKTITRNADWKDNLTLFSNDVQIVSNSARAHYNAGTASFDAAKVEKNQTTKTQLLNKAIPHLKKATEIYPEYKDAFNNLGSAYNAAEQPQNAIPVFQELLEKDPAYFRAYYNLASAYEAANMNKQAAVAYGNFARYKPSATAYYRQAVAYGKANKLDEAIMALNKALEVNPNFNEAYLNLGQAYGMKGDYTASINAFETFLKTDSNNPEALDGIGTTYLLVGQTELAVQAFQKLVRQQPQNQTAIAKLQEAQSKLRQ